MARPIKEGLNYFPLDVDIDQDDKIAIIEALHGIEGFGVVIKLLMKIYKEGYFYEWNNREQILFSKRVNVDINTVKEIVNDCINEGLFCKNMFDAHNILTSKGIQKRYLEAIKRRKEVTFLEKFYLIDDPKSIIGTSNISIFVVDDNNNKVNVNINSVNANISTQRKENKRKKEYINNSPKSEIPNDVEKQFLEWWELYGKKEGRAKCLAKFKTILKKIDFETIKLGTERYLKHLENLKSVGAFVPQKKNPLTFLNGAHWEDEYTIQPQTQLALAQPRQSRFIDLDLGEGD